MKKSLIGNKNNVLKYSNPFEMFQFLSNVKNIKDIIKKNYIDQSAKQYRCLQCAGACTSHQQCAGCRATDLIQCNISILLKTIIKYPH